MTTIKAAIFDLGGTLWEYRPNLTIEGVLARVAPKALALLPPEEAEAIAPMDLAVAVRRAYLAEEHAAAAGDPRPLPGELPVIEALAGLGVVVGPATARQMLAALHVPESHTSRLLPGVEALLAALHGRGIRLGIISNRMHGGTLLLDDLDFFGISHYFASVVASCDAGQMKPHPSIYHRALDELGVLPGEAVMIGDDLTADVAGPRAVGMRAIWVRRPPGRTDPTPAGVPDVTGLDGILAALDTLTETAASASAPSSR